jgi:hypothetical protein
MNEIQQTRSEVEALQRYRRTGHHRGPEFLGRIRPDSRNCSDDASSIASDRPQLRSLIDSAAPESSQVGRTLAQHFQPKDFRCLTRSR